MRIAVQAISLILMTHAFGVKQYGVLAGITALYITIAQFVGLGSGVALVRHLSRNREENERIIITQRIYLASGLIAFFIALPLSLLLLGQLVTASTLICLAAAELVIAPTFMPMAYYYQAREHMLLSGAMQTLGPISRAGAVIFTVAMGAKALSTYALIHVSCLAITALVANRLFSFTRSGQPVGHSWLQSVKEGLPYMISGATITANGELDKTILLKIQGGLTTGLYAAAYRIMQAATLPVNSLILAATPRLFRVSNDGHNKLTRQLLIAVLAYAAMAALILVALSPFLHLILGKNFSASEALLRIFCLNILTNSVRQLVTGRMTTVDMQRDRNLIEIASLALSVSMLLFLTPRLGALGAILALAISDIAVIIMGTMRLTIASRI